MNAVATPSIQKTPGVCGGRARVGDTRIPVWGLVEYRKAGVSDARLLEFYPTLTQADLAEAWWYYAENRAEIERDIREQDEA